MNSNDQNTLAGAATSNAASGVSESPKSRPKERGRKRRRTSSSSSDDAMLPENALEVEKRIHESAIKNNLDPDSVRKIIKKVVTNDHVLALVQLQAEEEDRTNKEKNQRPAKLTRAKAKELMKASPNSAKWNLDNLELTPIKHIPVKTRPEVKALIAQELPEDEDDDEYEPTHDDVMSDDDHTLESCSDLESQPRTPATPRSHLNSPALRTDGPFKVPQESITPVRRRLQSEIEEDKATIALRTRSKLCLFDTPIEHIESNFVPPDALPPVVDHLWTDFLQDCLDPAQTSRHEEDDDADPEYSVAADPDAHEEEEAIENLLNFKVSRKELNDLVTELFHLMPEEVPDVVSCINNETTNGKELPENGKVPTQHWEGKQEPMSDEDVEMRNNTVSEKSSARFSIGKTEPVDEEETAVEEHTCEKETDKTASKGNTSGPPAPLVSLAREQAKQNVHQILIDTPFTVLPDQVALIQQQIRMHIQLAASNFLQLYVNPAHWNLAPTYKEYLETLNAIAEKNPSTVANVCNLKPAVEVVRSWEKSVSENTPRNAELVEFIQKENERMTRRYAQHSTFAGDFHPMFKDTVANSVVFLYPHLLPHGPYFAEFKRRVTYCIHEDRLLALGIEQFFSYVHNNPDIYKFKKNTEIGIRKGLSATLSLIQKHMFPWITLKNLTGHVQHARRDKDNPITKYLNENIIQPVQHKLLPFNPQLTLYEQPETEMPRLWIKHLAKTSKRFQNRLYARVSKAIEPEGVPINLGSIVELPKKIPLPINYKHSTEDPILSTIQPDRINVNIAPKPVPISTKHVFKVVQTNNGTVLIPISVNPPEMTKATTTGEAAVHCKCCLLIESWRRKKQSVITDFFKPKTEMIRSCPCSPRRRSLVTKRLKYLVNFCRTNLKRSHSMIKHKLEMLNSVAHCNLVIEDTVSDKEELDYAYSYQIRLSAEMSIARNRYMKAKVFRILSTFDPDVDDPLELATSMKKALDSELVDMYKEFLSFLTSEQADKIGGFADYFKHYCVVGLLERIDKEITSKEAKVLVLKQLDALFSDNISGACQMCCNLLNTMCGYPKLAEYTFSLFPHRRIKVVKLVTTSQKTQMPAAGHVHTLNNEDVPVNSDDDNEGNLKIADDEGGDLNIIDDNGEDLIANDNGGDLDIADDNGGDLNTAANDDDTASESDEMDDKQNITVEENILEDLTQSSDVNMDAADANSEQPNKDTRTSQTIKTEQDSGSESEMSMLVMSDDDTIKHEPLEWSRNEDKLILETLKEKLTPEEQKDKTILEIIQQNEVLTLLSNGLPDKSMDEIRDRIKYLMFLLNNNK